MQSSGGKMEEGFGVPDGKRRGIYTYEAPWTIFGMNWSVRAGTKFRLAVGSVIEDFRNKVEIVYLDSSTGLFLSDPSLSFDHPFPPTKLMFIPDTSSSHPDLLATTSDTLRLWHIRDDSDGGGPRVELQCVLLPPLPSDFCSPLTSFDWNDADVRRVCTSSLDTSCTVWDLETSGMVKQLIEHDRVVLDVAWRGGVVDEFASVSADGSLRVFDLRDTRASQIIYESKPSAATPLLRLGWNKQHTYLLATVPMDSAKVVVLDIRYPNLPLWELERHQAGVNAVSWAPHSARHLCSAGDDAQALIWDVSAMPVDDGGLEPILAYWAGEEVNQLQWSSSHSDWVAIAFANKLQVLRV